MSRAPQVGLLLVSLVVFLTASCSDSTGPSSPADLRLLSGNNQSAEVGTELPELLIVEVTDQHGNPVPEVTVAWRTSAGEVQSVNPVTDGTGAAIARWILGTGAGEKTATATVRDLPPVTFTATAIAGPVASVAVEPDSVRLYALGDSVQLRGSATDQHGNGKPHTILTWESLDTTVAAVPGAGIVESKNNGTAGVVASSAGDINDTAFVQVTQEPAAISIRPAEDTLTAINDTAFLSSRVSDRNGHPILAAHVVWESSDPEVAVVDGTGAVVAKANGTSFVRAEAGEVVDTAEIVVRQAVASVTVSPAADTLLLRDTVQFVASAKDSNGVTVEHAIFSWSSTEPGVSTVSSDGVVIAVGDGHTTIKATSEGESGVANVRVVALTFTALATGGEHACGLTETGKVYCWGLNSNSRLGTTPPDVPDTCEHPRRGTFPPCSTKPFPLNTDLEFTELSAGRAHTCARTAAAQPYCWGDNREGQLGNGTRSSGSGVASVVGGLSFSPNFDGSGAHTCAIDTSGHTYCWGNNTYGQLGDGSTINRLTPVRAADGISLDSISAGGGLGGYVHTCGLAADGSAYCWGGNGQGQLGNGAMSNTQTTPVGVTGGHVFDDLTTGREHTCAVTTQGEAYCWGANWFGSLGTGSEARRTTPTRVSGSQPFIKIGGGFAHTCALTTDGVAYCWGANQAGQLGVHPSSTTDRCSAFGLTRPCSEIPVRVSGTVRFESLSLGGHFACGLSVHGVAYCWGANEFGQLGNGLKANRSAPVRVRGQR